MSSIEEIKAAIEALPQADFARLRRWLQERDWQDWDRQIEADSRSGKLEFLVIEALDGSTRGPGELI
jgi:hypothetical protein